MRPPRRVPAASFSSRATSCTASRTSAASREALDDEQNLFLFKMDMVGRAFARLVPRHNDRGGATGGLGGEEHMHVEAERLDRQRLFGRDDGGLHWVRASMDVVSSSS